MAEFPNFSWIHDVHTTLFLSEKFNHNMKLFESVFSLKTHKKCRIFCFIFALLTQKEYLVSRNLSSDLKYIRHLATGLIKNMILKVSKSSSG